MSKFAFFLAVTMLPTAWAQQPADAPAAPVNASISGTVRNKTTGAPLKDYTVSTTITLSASSNAKPASKDVTARTDAQGHYRLSDLPPAQYRLRMQGPEGFLGATGARTAIV